MAELSQSNKQTLIDAVVHAVNEDYYEMATDFIKLVRSCAASFRHCNIFRPLKRCWSCVQVHGGVSVLTAQPTVKAQWQFLALSNQTVRCG